MYVHNEQDQRKWGDPCGEVQSNLKKVSHPKQVCFSDSECCAQHGIAWSICSSSFAPVRLHFPSEQKHVKGCVRHADLFITLRSQETLHKITKFFLNKLQNSIPLRMKALPPTVLQHMCLAVTALEVCILFRSEECFPKMCRQSKRFRMKVKSHGTHLNWCTFIEHVSKIDAAF